MAALTITGQVAVVMGFVMSSVTTLFPSPPNQLSTGSLPALFVRNAKTQSASRTLTYGSGDLPVISFEICVIVEAVRQGNQFDTYAKTRRIMDELQAAIETNAELLRLDNHSIVEGFESAVDTNYFAVIATLEMS